MTIHTSREQRRQLARDNAKLPPLIGVYAITHRATGVLYVGISVDIRRRWAKHRTDLNCRRHHAPGLQRAWSKHGEGAFDFTVLETCSREALRTSEARWLESFPRTFNALRPQGMAGVLQHSADSRRRMSLAQKARGMKLSTEHMELMVQRRRECVGWNFSPLARERMRAAALKKDPPTQETRERLREANSRRVYRVVRRLTDGATFKSLADAGREHGISNAAICNAIKRGSRAAGHHWEYA